MSRHFKLRSLVFKPFLMSRHCCCDVSTLTRSFAVMCDVVADVVAMS